MSALIPRSGVTGLRREMDRLFERFWEPEFVELPALGEWAPALDLSETKESVVVKAEVPGIEPKDIQVTLEGQVLTVRGERKHEKEEKEEHYYRRERSYGLFARSVRLPTSVDSNRVDAKFKNGLLTVTLLKKPEARGTSIPIKAE